ncbi:hypothetical protein [Streptococcus suis]|uniref:hypothetical protein n=1 Tax=Streptococcus suis TaxID=1307 RepID=UPI000CF6662F|nr:hypothetical protein [Streptococcus suis]
MNTSKLTQFATAVGTDIKAINAQLATKATQESVTQAIAEFKTAIKSEILGEGVPEQLDTLKELADAIKNMNSSAESAIVEKLANHGNQLDNIANLDLVATYTAAKV